METRIRSSCCLVLSLKDFRDKLEKRSDLRGMVGVEESDLEVPLIGSDFVTIFWVSSEGKEWC